MRPWSEHRSIWEQSYPYWRGVLRRRARQEGVSGVSVRPEAAPGGETPRGYQPRYPTQTCVSSGDNLKWVSPIEPASTRQRPPVPDTSRVSGTPLLRLPSLLQHVYIDARSQGVQAIERLHCKIDPNLIVVTVGVRRPGVRDTPGRQEGEPPGMPGKRADPRRDGSGPSIYTWRWFSSLRTWTDHPALDAIYFT